jgi:hypothetical protein
MRRFYPSFRITLNTPEPIHTPHDEELINYTCLLHIRRDGRVTLRFLTGLLTASRTLQYIYANNNSFYTVSPAHRQAMQPPRPHERYSVLNRARSLMPHCMPCGDGTSGIHASHHYLTTSCRASMPSPAPWPWYCPCHCRRCPSRVPCTSRAQTAEPHSRNRAGMGQVPA